MGFCLFNNVAMAARRAQALGLGRVAIVDWDVHHGNGTEDDLRGRPLGAVRLPAPGRLLPARPRPGRAPGRGEGLGATVNVPLPAGSGDATYLRALEQVVVPALDAFAPDLLLVSSGQDAGRLGPAGPDERHRRGLPRADRARCASGPASHCDGRVVAVLEGGYSVDHMPFCTLATVEALAGLRPSLAADPIELDVPEAPLPHELAAIERARAAALS